LVYAEIKDVVLNKEILKCAERKNVIINITELCRDEGSGTL
jgi:hypothetical protein